MDLGPESANVDVKITIPEIVVTTCSDQEDVTFATDNNKSNIIDTILIFLFGFIIIDYKLMEVMCY